MSDIDEFELTLIRLEIIGKLKLGDKLHVDETNNFSIDHPSYLAPLYRWYFGNNRRFTTTHIESLLVKINSFTVDDKKKERLCRGIYNAIVGLRALTCTYSNDLQIVSSIENIIERFQLCMDEMKKVSPKSKS